MMNRHAVTAAAVAVALAGGMLVAAPASATTAGGRLWASNGSSSAALTSGSIAAGSTPSIATPPGGPTLQIVWQGTNGHLFSTGPTGPIDLQVAMADNTSPSLAELGTDSFFPSGGWAIAFQGANNTLWFDTQQGGPVDTRLPMAPGTSPAITTVTNGSSFQVVWHGANGDLWTTAGHPTDTGLAMYPGTSPSLTELGGVHEEVAIEGANGDLWIYGSNNPGDTHETMQLGTSPAVISFSTGFLVTYHGTDGNLITYGQGYQSGTFQTVPTGPWEWFEPMVSGTSPSLVNINNVPYIAFQNANTSTAPFGEVMTFVPPIDIYHQNQLFSDGAVDGSNGTSIAELRNGSYEVVFPTAH